MRWTHFIVLQAVILLIVVVVINKHDGKVAMVKMPPKSLAQWYKPESKRHVWLHNMFKLRRELQAVAFYAVQKDDEKLSKWADNLNTHYRKISEMVPEWQGKLDFSVLDDLQANVKHADYTGVLAQVDILQENCDSCHNDYQAITALTYRAPDFSAIEISPERSFVSHMNTLTEQVNLIKIAATDMSPELALASLEDLRTGMNTLGEVCVDCHKKDRKPYPSVEMQTTLASLEESLKTGTLRDQGMNLGTLAVQACATCHGTHRLIFGAKNLLIQDKNLSELLKH